MVEYENTLANAVALILLVLLVAYAILQWFLDRDKGRIATYLTLAERDLNNLLSGGLEHGGRKGKVAERREWIQSFLPPPPSPDSFGVITPSPYPIYGNFGSSEGFRNAAQELIQANEKDLGGKGTTMGKASITAFLLREIYEASIGAAQSKIFAETLNNGGTPPYIAPGIYELVGFAKFDPKTGFPPGAGVPGWLLKRVVRERNYPRDIQIIKTDAAGKRFRIEGMAVLRELTQQNL
ncbi:MULTISPECIES: hypothetical protein [Rhodomicrobium]|uniref:hypothetical protein n=1 Tax=Rhodomicrobium TaxID=1068 RepID=UPI000B4AC5C7|nr:MULTISPECIES: hypothetical protein [Rhodomicrobium]